MFSTESAYQRRVTPQSLVQSLCIGVDLLRIHNSAAYLAFNSDACWYDCFVANTSIEYKMAMGKNHVAQCSGLEIGLRRFCRYDDTP